MKTLIYNYLNTNFRLSLDTYAYHRLYDINTKKDKSIHHIITEIKTVFYVDTDIFIEAFDDWINLKVVELIDGLVEIKLKMELLTGREVSMGVADLDALTKSHEKFMTFVNLVSNPNDSEIGIGDEVVNEVGYEDVGEQPMLDNYVGETVEEMLTENGVGLKSLLIYSEGQYYDENGDLIISTD